MIMFVCWSILDFQMQAEKAREFHSNVVEQVQSTYANPNILQDCVDKANEVTYTDAEGTEHHMYTLTFEDATIDGEMPTVLVRLKYQTVSPIINLFGDEAEKYGTGIIEGYATSSGLVELP